MPLWLCIAERRPKSNESSGIVPTRVYRVELGSILVLDLKHVLSQADVHRILVEYSIIILGMSVHFFFIFHFAIQISGPATLPRS